MTGDEVDREEDRGEGVTRRLDEVYGGQEEEDEEGSETARFVSRMSALSFARDWDSEEDAPYDRLS